MKSARKLKWIVLGETLFLSLSVLLPHNQSFPNSLSGEVRAATTPVETQVVKVKKTLNLKASLPNQKALPTDVTSTQPKPIAQTSLLEERGALERGDASLPQDGSLYDVYSFEGRAGQSVTIRLESQDFDTYLILVDPENAPMAENDDVGRNNTNSALTVNLPTDGTYHVIANSHDARGQGRYTLNISSPETATVVREKPVLSQERSPQTREKPSGAGIANLSGDAQILAQADRLYLQGDRSEAQRLYRQVKPPFANEGSRPTAFPELISDPQQLSVSAQVYWRNLQDGLANGQETQVESSLSLLAEEAPNFLPVRVMHLEAMLEEGETEETIAILEELTTRYPQSAELARLRVRALSEDDQTLEASISARQFAIVNPDHPEAAEFIALADEHLDDFRGDIQEGMALRGLGGLAVGILTGNTQSSIFQGIELIQLVAMGESGLGSQISEQVKRQVNLVEDPVVANYIDEIGQEVARYMGRDEFEYEFYVIEDDSLNAFALPGGKVFINTGAILAANSEAELAGLLAHEVAHAVLSHGYEGIMTNLFLANVGREIPLGDILSTLVSLDYSRSQETQADIIGTRVLNSAGYAADGLRNLMVTLGQENGSGPPSFLSTHPATDDRVEYMEALIEQNGYNRYAFEGVERLSQIQNRLN